MLLESSFLNFSGSTFLNSENNYLFSSMFVRSAPHGKFLCFLDGSFNIAHQLPHWLWSPNCRFRTTEGIPFWCVLHPPLLEIAYSWSLSWLHWWFLLRVLYITGLACRVEMKDSFFTWFLSDTFWIEGQTSTLARLKAVELSSPMRVVTMAFFSFVDFAFLQPCWVPLPWQTFSSFSCRCVALDPFAVF